MQGGAVGFEAVGQAPGGDELEAGWDKESDLFGEGAGEEVGCGWVEGFEG